MITLLLIIPLIGVIFLLPFNESSNRSKVFMKQIFLIVSLINFLISIILWYLFDLNTTTYQFVQEYSIPYLEFCHFYVGIDGVSIYFVLLTTFITPLCILSNWTDISNNNSFNNDSISLRVLSLPYGRAERIINLAIGKKSPVINLVNLRNLGKNLSNLIFSVAPAADKNLFNSSLKEEKNFFTTPKALNKNIPVTYTEKKGTGSLKYFLISFLILETLQIAVFVVLDLFLFYIFFESVLIPLFFIVLIWGGSLKKIRAAFLLFLYTLTGSLFMLLSILFIYLNVGSTDLLFLSISNINLNYQKILWLGFFISFAIKTPLFPFHLWLFRAHAEAPLAGSIILAAVILKLASYGFLRVILPIFPEASLFYLPLIQSIASITIVYASLSTLRQFDTKQLVAMSSVAHMGVVILGIFSNNIQGIEGSILLGISHGFVSPALFICVGGIIYSRFHTRIINYLKGLVNRMPLFTLLFFIFILFNTAIPLSLNYLGEFLSLNGVFQQSPYIAIIGASGIVLSAAYSIWCYTRISYGSYSNNLINKIKTIKDINRREFFLLLPLFIVTFIFGIFPNFILNSLHISISSIIYNIII